VYPAQQPLLRLRQHLALRGAPHALPEVRPARVAPLPGGERRQRQVVVAHPAEALPVPVALARQLCRRLACGVRHCLRSGCITCAQRRLCYARGVCLLKLWVLFWRILHARARARHGTQRAQNIR